MEKTQCYEVHKKYLADALSFLGFRYYKFTNFKGNEVYSFKNTNEFQKAINGLSELKQSINN